MVFSIQILLITLSVTLQSSMRCLAQDTSTESICGDTKFVVVMDAGSTKTMTNVFQFNAVARGELVMVQTIAKKIRPALSYYANNMHEISRMRADLSSLISFSKRHIIPPECIRITPILLKATAGLRNVGERMAEKILTEVRGVFMKSGFLFKNDQVSLLSGDGEAIYAWMSANFLLKTLEIYEEGSPSSPPQTYGILDLGGGSTQITFVPEYKMNSVIPDRMTTLETDIKNYTLYRHSYSFNGIDEAKLQMLNLSPACRAGRCAGEIYTSPCLHPEYIGELSYGSSRLEVRGMPSNAEDCRFCHCLRSAYQLVSKVESVRHTFNCKSFIGMASYYFLYDNMRQLQGENSQRIHYTTLRQILKDAMDICKNPVKDEPKIQKAAFLCMDLTYVFALLHKGYMFELDDKFILAREIHGGSLTWALGLAIHTIL